MTRYLFIVLVLVVLSEGCSPQESESKTQKDKLVENLQKIEKSIDTKISELKEQSDLSSGQVLKDIESSIKELEKEKKKIRRSIKKGVSASEKELEALKAEARRFEKEASELREKVNQKLKKLKKSK